MPYKDASVKKAKHAQYSRKHYEKNGVAIRLQTKEAKAALRKEWYAFKATLKCAHCGFFHIAALDFHHEDPSTKENNVHSLVSNGQFAKAYEEIKKCIVLCANCHRIYHHKEKVLQSP